MAMPQKVSTLEVRQRIGDLLNRVALRQDEFIIEREGKPLAALVSVERLQQLHRFARLEALQFMNTQEAGTLSEHEAEAIALEAQRSVRRVTGVTRPPTRSARAVIKRTR